MSTAATMTSREAAEYLGVSLATVRRWSDAGVGPACWRTPGGARRYDKAELDAWLAAQREENGQPA